jgi:hypothetical protein
MNPRTKYGYAGAVVDGRTVREEIPNLGSIGASLTDYEILPGVRVVPFSAFTQMEPLHYYSVELERRVKNLAELIRLSRELNPLIVVEDSKGPYILEGAHRFDALRELEARSFPALVVLDLESLNLSP